MQLYRRLRAARADLDLGGGVSGVTRWIKEFSLETWRADAEVVINVLALVLLEEECLRTLSLYIGPNFSPEHLEEMFRRTNVGVRCLNLRFRP